MVILALETTSNICSVALGEPGSYLEDSRDIPRKHNEQLLEMIDSMYKHSPYDRQDIDCIAFSAGPGSFTGVRLGASVTQAIASAWECKAYSVPTALVAARIAQKGHDKFENVTVIRRSRNEWVYEARLGLNSRNDLHITDEKLVHESDCAQEGIVVRDSQVNLSASTVLEIAAELNSEWHPPHLALPNYVAGDTPWKKTHSH